MLKSTLPPRSSIFLAALIAVVSSYPADPGGPSPLQLDLPTANHGLIEGHPELFYMGVDRPQAGNANNLAWEAGQFGFVRSPLSSGEGTVFTQFHDGIDVAPVAHDAGAPPRDVVRSIAAGHVIFCQADPAGSNYGNHVVIEHDWNCGPVYSLYAHLESVRVQLGEKIDMGSPLGVLGHTGTGIESRRAHLHLEIDLMLHADFDPARWRPSSEKCSDGKFDVQNLAGIDPAAFYLAVKKDASTTLPNFVASLKPYFTITVPRHGEVDLLRRHRWLRGGSPPTDEPAWDISFAAWGLPLRFTPVRKTIKEPVVSWVENLPGPHAWRTRGLISGSGPVAVLTPVGLARLHVIMNEPESIRQGGRN